MRGDQSSQVMLASARVMRWVEFYTRGLPDAVATDRRDELLADLHDQCAEAAERHIDNARVARGLMVRALKGAPADLAWRRNQILIASPTGAIQSGGLLAAALVGAGLMVMFGLVTALRGLHVGTGSLIPWRTDPAFIAVVAGTAAASCALTLIARRRTRFVGALWLAVASQLLLVPGLEVLTPTSTVLAWASVTEPSMRVCVLIASVGLSLVAVAVALAWMPAARRAKVTT